MSSRENKAFSALKALDLKDAKLLEVYKKECEENLKNRAAFELKYTLPLSRKRIPI